MIKLALGIVIIFLLSGCQSTAKLKAPDGYYPKVFPNHGSSVQSPSFTCQNSLAPYTGPLQFNSKYEGSGKARDTLNKEANHRYQTATKSIRQYEKTVIKVSDRLIHNDTRNADLHAQCLVRYLSEWAGENALLSSAANSTGKAVRKWALSAIGSSYLKLKLYLAEQRNMPQSSFMKENSDKLAKTERWLEQLSGQVIKDYSDRPAEKQNNHDYWAAWSVMVTSVALNNQAHYQWSIEKMELGLRQINAAGFLPNELKRETRALSYHNFAIMPLMIMAVFAEVNGNPITPILRQRLALLADNVLSGISNPETFVTLTGTEQHQEGLRTSYALAWLEPYAVLFAPSDQADILLSELHPMRATRLGGNLSDLFRPQANKYQTN